MDLNTVVGEINPFSFLLLIPLLFLLFKFKSPKAPRLPPGPNPLPIVGNIFQTTGKTPHIKLSNLAKIHGPIMSLRLGKQVLIVGSSPAAAVEILKTSDRALCGRYVPFAHPAKSPELNHLSLGFASECNDHWKNLRAVCQSELFSTKAVESQVKIREEKLMKMVRFLGGKEGEVVKLGEIVFGAMFNTLTNILFSKDVVDFEGKGEGVHVKELIKKSLELFFSPNLSDFYPIFSPLDVRGFQKKSAQVHKILFGIWGNIANERSKQRSDRVSNHRDFLDALIETGFTNDQIVNLFQELLTAGTDTSTTTIEKVTAEFLKNPKVMNKLRDEIRGQVGKDMVRESHLPHLPYLQACLKEVLRLHPPAPTLLPHRALETCEIMGYTIPKDAQVLVNIWAIGRDPMTWDDPLSFKPERFLDSELSFIGNDFTLIPFSAGRRICPGVQMAARQVPLIIATLVHSFDWLLPGNMNPAELDMEEPLQVIPKARK